MGCTSDLRGYSFAMSIPLMLALDALGYCSSAPLAVFPPPTAELPDRPQLTISWGAPLPRSPDPDRFVAAQPQLTHTDGRTVALVEVDRLQAQLEQMVLTTADRLDAGTWHLTFATGARFAWARDLAWTSTGQPDDEPPVWFGAAQQNEVWAMIPQICGEVAIIDLRVPVVDRGPVQIQAELWSAVGTVGDDGPRPQAMQRYRIAVVDGRINLATGYCEGNFRLTRGRHWLNLIAIDTAGHAAAADDMPMPLKL